MSERTPEDALQSYADWMSPLDPGEVHKVYGLSSKDAHLVLCELRQLRTALAAATKRAEEAEAKLAQSTNYVADHDTHPTCVWFANGRVVSVNAAGVLEIRFGKQLEACDE